MPLSRLETAAPASRTRKPPSRGFSFLVRHEPTARASPSETKRPDANNRSHKNIRPRTENERRAPRAPLTRSRSASRPAAPHTATRRPGAPQEPTEGPQTHEDLPDDAGQGNEATPRRTPLLGARSELAGLPPHRFPAESAAERLEPDRKGRNQNTEPNHRGLGLGEGTGASAVPSPNTPPESPPGSPGRARPRRRAAGGNGRHRAAGLRSQNAAEPAAQADTTQEAHTHNPEGFAGEP